jgi:hypothetical protein
MSMLAPLLAATLPACSNDPAPPAPPAGIETGGPTTPPASPTPAAAPSPVAAVPPHPTSPKTFGDWTVACDNVRICTMASLGPETADFPPITLALTRQPGPGGGWSLAFQTSYDTPALEPVAATVDGRRLALPTLDRAPAAAVAAAMANGSALGVVEASGPRRATLSLKGASAALRWIDAQQGRAGTITAIVAKGDRPAASVPAAARAPVIEALTPGGTAARLTPQIVADLRRRAACDDEIVRNAGLEPEAHALGGGATLVMLPCSTGAYNLSSTLFVVRDGRITSAPVDAPTGFGPTPAAGIDPLTSVVNGSWKDGELTSLAKGRGLGDCGVAQTLVWDGTRLRLSEQSEMGECRGNTNYLTTWRTKVVRR